MDPSLLPSLAWFVHVARQRSFSRAAVEMGVSCATLSQGLKALERRLNVKLIHRTTRNIPQTPAELIRHNCIAYRFTNGAIFNWRFAAPDAGDRAFTMEPRGNLVTNDDEGMVRAALDGLGLMQHIDLAVRAPGDLPRVSRGNGQATAGKARGPNLK